MEFQETAAKSKPSQPVPEVVPTRYWKMPVLALAVTLLLLGLLGFIAVESTKHAINKSVYGRLEAVAKLKALQVVHMLDEAGEPIEKMASSPQISGALESWLGRGIRNEAKEQQVRDYLVDSIKGTDYVGLSVLSIENGTSLLSVGSEIGGGMNNHRAIPAMPNSEAVLEDIHFDKTMTGPAIRVGYFCLVRSRHSNNPIAVLHASVDPFWFLQSMLKEWPGLTRSGEILLMRRDKNGFMILNKQSIRPDIEPIDRLTNSSPTIAASFDLLERPGQQYGRDFRGERVLAFGTAIEGSQWKLVAKIDEAEIYEHINNLAMVVGVALATIAVMGCIGWAAHNRHVLISHQQHVDSIMLAKRIDYLARYANDCIVVCDAHGNILEVNNRCLSTYGYDLAEMQGMPAIELLSPECRNDQATIMERLFHERRLLFETMHCRKDGTTFPVEVSACLIEFEGVLCLQEIIRDISERRRIEDQRAEYVRHITEASSRFLTVQEQERRILARELHDKTGANLSAITLNLKALSNALPDTVVRKCKRLLDDINELLINTVVDLRHICSELRPAMLDYADLKDALLDLAASFAQRTGIAAHVDLDAFDGQCPTDTASLLFRIVQEALTNCAKHSDARNVDIRLANSEGTAVLVVTDDGKGFSPELFGQTEHKPGLGLLMIKERVEFLGGRFTVNSSPGAGTEIKVEWQMIFGPQSASSPIELELARVRLSRVA